MRSSTRVLRRRPGRQEGPPRAPGRRWRAQLRRRRTSRHSRSGVSPTGARRPSVSLVLAIERVRVPPRVLRCRIPLGAGSRHTRARTATASPPPRWRSDSGGRGAGSAAPCHHSADQRRACGCCCRWAEGLRRRAGAVAIGRGRRAPGPGGRCEHVTGPARHTALLDRRAQRGAEATRTPVAPADQPLELLAFEGPCSSSARATSSISRSRSSRALAASLLLVPPVPTMPGE